MAMPLHSASDATNIIMWAQEQMLRNISPAGTRPGAVIASPSRSEPDYYYCWVRDGALVMDVVLSLNDRKRLEDYVEFSRFSQTTPDRKTGLGEPKFHVDGTAFTGDWGRPQDDGPALRAITLIRFANCLLEAGERDYVIRRLYTATMPAETGIKADLEYVSESWYEPCYDYWEEECAFHFSTRMTQRRALLDGADLAGRLNDPGAAACYRHHAASLGAALEAHWDRKAGYLLTSLDHRGGIDDKKSGLDVSVILGALHGEVPGKSFSVTDDYLLATALRLRERFDGLYDINIDKQDRPGVAIGRYPEDRYNGYTSTGRGNPWFLTTNAFAEYYYRVAAAWRDGGEIRLSATNLPFLRGLLDRQQADQLSVGARLHPGSDLFEMILAGLCRDGDEFVRRTLAHAADGALSEQIHRDSGEMTAAPHLTWSYASLISALLHRPVWAAYS
jgi:glucoamylase